MNRIYLNSLFDIYSELFTPHEIETYKEYYYNDLSLSEIAENNDVTRNAIHKTLKNVCDKLNFYEDKLHIYKNKTIIKNYLDNNKIEELKKFIG